MGANPIRQEILSLLSSRGNPIPVVVEMCDSKPSPHITEVYEGQTKHSPGGITSGEDSSSFLSHRNFPTALHFVIMVAGWESRAKAKREAILNSIPEKWRLQKIPSPEE